MEAEAGRREAILDLESELRARGETGSGERLAEKEEELREAAAGSRARACEALAWKLLHDELDAAERGDREALVEPVAAPRSWLRRLFPGAEPRARPADASRSSSWRAAASPSATTA